MEQASSRPSTPLPILGLPHFNSKLVAVLDVTNRIVKLDGQRSVEAGGFADVYKCQFKSDGGVTEVAVKVFRFMFLVDEQGVEEKQIKAMRRELGIWSMLNHPNIVPFLGIAHGFGRDGNASLVSLWMPNGTIQRYLSAYEDQLAVVRRLQLLSDIAEGLCYLHSFQIVHGDLSCNNVLIDRHHRARLVDFGFASLIGESPAGFTYLEMTRMNIAVTLRWSAPEYLLPDSDGDRRTTKSDIYSFGNMALLVLSGRQPWSEVREDCAVLLHLYQGHKPDRPSSRPIEDEHWELIEQCWTQTDARPCAKDIVSSFQQFLGLYQPSQADNQLECNRTAATQPVHEEYPEVFSASTMSSSSTPADSTSLSTRNGNQRSRSTAQATQPQAGSPRPEVFSAITTSPSTPAFNNHSNYSNSSRSPESPAQLYARHHHFPSHYGYPLWDPVLKGTHELPQYYQREGVQIGDVGVVIPQDGSFNVLFNICLPSDSSLHRRHGVPSNFRPCLLEDDQIEVLATGGSGLVISNPSVVCMAQTSVEYTFRLPSHDGAVLVLPRGATRYSLKDGRIFREAAAQNALEWYQFATSILGQDLGGGFLCLVTGAYKARTWAHATFREVSENVTQDRVVRFGPNGDSPAGYAWTNAPAVDHRVCLPNQYEYENQSMFISGFNISVRDNVPRWVVMPVRAGLLDTLIRRLGMSAMKWLSPSRTTVGMPMAMYYLSEIIGKSDDCAFSATMHNLDVVLGLCWQGDS